VSKWEPLLKEPLRSEALAVVDLIAESLRRRVIKKAALANGSAGLAILFDYLSEAQRGNREKQIARKFLDQAADAVATTRMSPSFFGGFTGVAWAVAHLERRCWPDRDGEDSNQLIDEALKLYLSQKPWEEDYDLIRGLVGYGVYAVERLPKRSAIDCLTLVVKRLSEIAKRTRAGVTWHTAPELLPKAGNEDLPLGYYNLGLAHGVPGVIAFLSQVCATDDKRLRDTCAKARQLLQGAVTWVLRQRPADRSQSYPCFVGPGISPMPAHAGWFYGDLGIASALLTAARCVNEPAWEGQAVVIARRAAVRPAEQWEVVDCGLCCGAAGVGHLFNRLFQATGEARFSAAARFWFKRTLAERHQSKGIAGFVACSVGRSGPNEKRWIAAPGILHGAAGIALALLAATTSIEPEWDRILLLSRRSDLP